ncbi:hypothetical protein JZ751_017003 [Albula glossodonta]|uniref:Uncharacterized protein n=1 Tax=Albula glossodonta TaxID=121402 RepID=A0A8T2N096_9TELE|nr:hypothetical protein JZ751_017003 [Albula glossodonta]
MVVLVEAADPGGTESVTGGPGSKEEVMSQKGEDQNKHQHIDVMSTLIALRSFYRRCLLELERRLHVPFSRSK